MDSSDWALLLGALGGGLGGYFGGQKRADREDERLDKILAATTTPTDTDTDTDTDPGPNPNLIGDFWNLLGGGIDGNPDTFFNEGGVVPKPKRGLVDEPGGYAGIKDYLNPLGNPLKLKSIPMQNELIDLMYGGRHGIADFLSNLGMYFYNQGGRVGYDTGGSIEDLLAEHGTMMHEDALGSFGINKGPILPGQGPGFMSALGDVFTPNALVEEFRNLFGMETDYEEMLKELDEAGMTEYDLIQTMLEN